MHMHMHMSHAHVHVHVHVHAHMLAAGLRTQARGLTTRSLTYRQEEAAGLYISSGGRAREMQAGLASPRPAILTMAILLTIAILLPVAILLTMALLTMALPTVALLTMAAGDAGGVGLPDGAAAATARQARGR